MDAEDCSQYSEAGDSAPYQLSAEVWMVACAIDHKTNSFVPVTKPSLENLTERFPSRQPWLPLEDDMLKSIIAAKGTRVWTAIAQKLNIQMHQGAPIRHGKQCRERWYNHLDPSIRKGSWSPREDLLVLEKQLELGNRWSDISKMLPGRNENSVKNRWKSMVRKAQKVLPAGTDISRWLIADRKSQDADALEIISPVVCASSPFGQYPISVLSVTLPVMSPMALPVVAMDSAKQQFFWLPYNFQSPKDASASPSSAVMAYTTD